MIIVVSSRIMVLLLSSSNGNVTLSRSLHPCPLHALPRPWQCSCSDSNDYNNINNDTDNDNHCDDVDDHNDADDRDNGANDAHNNDDYHH